MNARARRFPLLDSLRAVAAILVLGSHAAGPAGATRPGAGALPYAARLNAGVAIFFVISGFLLYRPFSRSRLAGSPRPDLRSYAAGRFLRIAPAYWAALTIIALWLPRPGVLDTTWWHFYGLAQIYVGYPLAGIGAAWSLCVEAGFYVLLPLFALAMARLPGRGVRAELAGIGGLAAVAIAARAALPPDGNPGSLRFLYPVAFLDWFALGMALAVATLVLERHRALPRPVRFVERFPAAAWALALAIFIADARYFNGKASAFTRFENFLEHFAYGAIALALVVPLAVGDQTRGFLRRVLANPVLMYLGLISYGIFLWHEAVIEQLQRWNLGAVGFVHPYLLWLVATLAITTAIASVSYYALERPALRLRPLLAGRRSAGPRDEAVAEPAPAAPLEVREPV